MDLDKAIAEAVEEKTRGVTAPPLNVNALMRQGGRRIAARRAGVAVAAVAALAASGGVVSLVGDTRSAEPPVVLAAGELSYEHGLRAYMDPGSEEIHLGGGKVSIENAWRLDTDGIATRHGLIGFEKDRRPYLLKEDGTVTYLGPAPDSSGERFLPRAKSDAALPLVAWTEHSDAEVTVRLYDLRAAEFVDSLRAPCGSAEACKKVRVEAVDQGLVFVRTPEGNHVWDPSADGDARWTRLGGSTIADVRNKVIMMTGASPDVADLPAESPVGEDWRFFKGEIDAQLSHDGRWKLHWSKTLTPTSDRDRAIELDVASAEFVTFDTDGSVLVAMSPGRRGGDGAAPAKLPTCPPKCSVRVPAGSEGAEAVRSKLPTPPSEGASQPANTTVEPGDAPTRRYGAGPEQSRAVEPRHAPAGSGNVYRMYDCELPSGTCVEIGKLKVTGGDPLFIGNDM